MRAPWQSPTDEIRSGQLLPSNPITVGSSATLAVQPEPTDDGNYGDLVGEGSLAGGKSSRDTMKRPLSRLTPLLILLCASCLPGVPNAPRANAQSKKALELQHGLQSGEHVLFRPQGEPRILLGREVTTGVDGHPVVASKRKPGGTVLPKSVLENRT